MMKNKNVLLIGFQDQGNLGIGYLTATLREHGYDVCVIDFRQDHRAILNVTQSVKPVLIGFSLIFQYYSPQFAKLASYLRSHDVVCHFCIGGHYPSLCHEDVLRMIPDIESVVRFEGESTLLELVDRLSNCQEWHDIPGIAYRRNGNIVTNPLRPLITDLDILHHPWRSSKPEQVLGRIMMPILASRGCVRGCSFCSIRQFYTQPPGKVRRTRTPVNVVSEMRTLHEQNGASVFLFQDDDFFLLGKTGWQWAHDFIDELDRQGLVGRVIWKISCRADEVKTDLFSSLRDAGLYVVYLGLESGNEEGLRVLNKRISVEQNLQAVSILKDLDIMFVFGFMLFDPSSTFDTVRYNIVFLRQIVGDGSSAVTFCKMLPYAGTDIEKELAKEGRLRGSVAQPDYSFLDPRLESYYNYVSQMASSWIDGPDALSPQFSSALHEIEVIRHLFPPVQGLDEYKSRLRSMVRESNDVLLSAVEQTCAIFELGTRPQVSRSELDNSCEKLSIDLINSRNTFIQSNQEVLLKALAGEHMVRT
ncbi:B12-binding domain-containing radical SAM protein [Chloroflexota bacterium]